MDPLANQEKAAGFRTAQPLFPGSGITASDKNTFFLNRSEESHACKPYEPAVPGRFFRFLTQNYTDLFQPCCELHQKCLAPGRFLN
jgi:hypothetical protein